MSDDKNGPMLAVYLEAQKWGYQLSTTEAAHLAEAALEASVRAPAVDHEALIAEAREREHEWSSRQQMPSDVVLVARLADVLEASVQAPAVDREALIAEAREFADRNNGMNWQGVVLRLADALEASVQNAWEVEARGLEKAADEWQTKDWADTPRHADRVADRMGASQYALEWMRVRAQQVRKGN